MPLDLLKDSPVRSRLAAAVANAIATSARRIARVEVEAPGLSALAWLQAVPRGSRMYWSGRDEPGSVAATGEALRTDSAAGLPPLGDDVDPGVRFFGGMRFDPRRKPAQEWEELGAGSFVLPRYELLERVQGTWIACNLVLPRDRERGDRILAEIDQLPLDATEVAGILPRILERRDSPDDAGWERNVLAVLDAVASTSLGKVVLARRTDLILSDEADPVLLLARLRTSTPGCFHFLFESSGSATFIGASPERLYRRDRRRVWSEAVAGTRRRSASELEDAVLSHDLLNSEKDQREHEYVRQSIKEVLGSLCVTLHLDGEASEMRLARGRHLYSGLKGTLRDDTTDDQLLRALHPTPAVGGHPTREAIEMIARVEPFDRGWYAGPVGWLGVEGAELAVGIRSGLVHGRTISLYSGAGIVRGSDASSEWNEIEQKIMDFQSVFGRDEVGA